MTVDSGGLSLISEFPSVFGSSRGMSASLTQASKTQAPTHLKDSTHLNTSEGIINKSLCGKCSEHTEYKSHSVRRSVKHCNLHSNFRSKHVIKNAVRTVQRSTKAKVYSEAECEARGGSGV